MPTVAELKAEAERRGIEIPKKARKAEIERLLNENPLTVLEAVNTDLAEIAKRDSQVANSTLAATARELARMLDDRSNSATSKSQCAKSLAEIFDRLNALAPPPEEGDRLDELLDS